MEISESRSILSVTFMCSCKARFSFSASQYCFWVSSRRRNPWGIRKISLFVWLCLEITFKCCLFPFKSGTAANLRPYARMCLFVWLFMHPFLIGGLCLKLWPYSLPQLGWGWVLIEVQNDSKLTWIKALLGFSFPTIFLSLISVAYKLPH